VTCGTAEKKARCGGTAALQLNDNGMWRDNIALASPQCGRAIYGGMGRMSGEMVMAPKSMKKKRRDVASSASENVIIW